MNTKIWIFISTIVVFLTACTAAPQITGSYDPAALKFDGDRAFGIETEMVTRFPDRASGYPNNHLAAEWIKEYMSNLGWECFVDRWEVVNYSRPVPLNNVVCRLPGASKREILVIAHLDQASTTIQGADNDAAGVAILMHMAEIFVKEAPLPYTLVFVATDGEEYGMFGSGRYIQTYPEPGNIIAGFSIDNAGRDYYDAVGMEQTGQYRKFGSLWLELTAREAARHAGNAWTVNLPDPVGQITGQMAPVSFMDQGPLVAAGIPSLGLTGTYPPEFTNLHKSLWHDPNDKLDHQSASTVGQIGRVAEALIRQLLSMQSFPRESGPYLYFEASDQVLRGWPLWLIFIGFASIFFLGSFLVTRMPFVEKMRLWKNALPHFLGLWLPLLAFIVMLYLFVEIGLLLSFYRYPATTKDPYLMNPNWLVFALALSGLAVFLALGHRIVRGFTKPSQDPLPGAIKSLALFIIGLAAIYVLALNPFSLLFFLPLLFWFLIRSRRGPGKYLDILFFLLGGLMIYGLIYYFGFVNLRYNFGFFWYLLNMMSTRMVSFPSMAAVTAVIAAGLSMVVNPPRKAAEKVAPTSSPAGA